MIVQAFTLRDAAAILKTPVSPEGHDDRLIWHFTNTGTYSVKSGYLLAKKLIAGSRVRDVEQWNKLWRTKAPPRVKDHLWRVCKDVLPHKQNLASKGIITDSLCGFCGDQLENNWHIFFSCQFALKCWEEAGLREVIERKMGQVDSIRGLVLGLMSELEAGSAGLFSTIMWRVWRERNSNLWDGAYLMPNRVVTEARQYLLEWGATTRPEKRRSDATPCTAWHPPPASFLKINVDSAFFDEEQETGTGMIIKDEDGAFVAARTYRFSGCLEVKVGEALGILEALSWIQNLGLQKVLVEGDAKIVIDDINAKGKGITAYDDIIQSCRSILNNLREVKVCFVKRSANATAHVLARNSRFFESPNCWVDPPEFVVGLPVDACVCG